MSGYNDNPTVFEVDQRNGSKVLTLLDFDDNVVDEISREEIFQLIRSINDPEHPLTLEQLNVVSKSDINIDICNDIIQIIFTPTIPHCSMATLIGLCIRAKLLRTLPPHYKIDILVKKNTHQSESQINKQLNDKERVAAAMENSHLLQVVNQCLTN